MYGGKNELNYVLYNKIFSSMWYLQCAMYSTFLIRISYKDQLFLFLEAVEKHYHKYTGQEKLVYSRWLRLHIYIWATASIILITLSAAGGIYHIVIGEKLMAPLPLHGSWNYSTKVFMGYTSILSSCTVFLTISLFAIICGIMYKEFVATRQKLEGIVKEDPTCGQVNFLDISGF